MHKIKIGVETNILHEIYQEMRSSHHLFCIIKEGYFKENSSEEDETVFDHLQKIVSGGRYLIFEENSVKQYIFFSDYNNSM